MGAAEFVDFFPVCFGPSQHALQDRTVCTHIYTCTLVCVCVWVCMCGCMCVCGCGCGCDCVVPEVGGWALVVIKRWNINATLPLISFHLSSSCPLCACLS